MKFIIIVLIGLGIYQQGFAESRKAETHVILVDPKLDSTSFKKEHVQVSRAPLIVKTDAKSRDSVFKSVGVASYVSKFSESQKDHLYELSGSAPVDTLKAEFPDIPRSLLADLRVAILKRGNR